MQASLMMEQVYVNILKSVPKQETTQRHVVYTFYAMSLTSTKKIENLLGKI